MFRTSSPPSADRPPTTGVVAGAPRAQAEPTPAPLPEPLPTWAAGTAPGAPTTGPADDRPEPVVPTGRRELPPAEVRFVAQPIVDLVRGTIPAVELLARPTGGGSLADWSIDELAARSRSLAHAALDAAATLPHDVGLVHVNVTALDLDESDFSEQVLRRFPRHRKHLILELTEQFELQPSRTVRGNLGRLRDAGVRFALDDFGEGWSSMVAMRMLRPAIVKVTTRGLQGKTLLDAEVSEWLIDRSAAVGCHRVVVEQLDTLEKVERVHALGFRLGQGRLLDRFVLGSLPGTERAGASARSDEVRLEHASLTLIA